MPPATLVRCAFPPNLARMMSCLGPQAFFQRPMISTGIDSGCVPSNTVQATPFMPGRNSEDLKISTFPDFGGCGTNSSAKVGSSAATSRTMPAASCLFIKPTPLVYSTMAVWRPVPRVASVVSHKFGQKCSRLPDGRGSVQTADSIEPRASEAESNGSRNFRDTIPAGPHQDEIVTV